MINLEIKLMENKKEIDTILYEKIQESEERNGRLFLNFYVLVSRFKKQNNELCKLNEKIKILEIENENLKNKLGSMNEEDKPIKLKGKDRLKQRMDELFLESKNT